MSDRLGCLVLQALFLLAINVAFWLYLYPWILRLVGWHL